MEFCQDCNHNFPCDECSHKPEEEKEESSVNHCEMCGCETDQYVPNPYDEDVYGEVHMQFLCDGCCQSLCSDI